MCAVFGMGGSVCGQYQGSQPQCGRPVGRAKGAGSSAQWAARRRARRLGAWSETAAPSSCICRGVDLKFSSSSQPA